MRGENPAYVYIFYSLSGSWMASLSQAKTLGGVGSILALLGIVPSVGPVLSIAGLIMSLVAVKYISDILGDKRIFNNMIIAVILGIGGIVVLVAFVFAAIARFIGIGNLFGASPGVSPTIPPSDIISLIAGLAIGLLAAWVLIIVSVVFRPLHEDGENRLDPRR